jgi:hypothetical protein
MTAPVENIEEQLLQSTVLYGIGIMVMTKSSEGISVRVVPHTEFKELGQMLMQIEDATQ